MSSGDELRGRGSVPTTVEGANQRWRRAEAQLAAISNAGVGVVVGTFDGAVLEANDACLALLGYTKNELVSGAVPWPSLTPAEWAAADIQTMAQLREAGIAQLREKQLIAKDGRRVPVMVAAALLSPPENLWVAVIHDMRTDGRTPALMEDLREARAALAAARGYLEAAPDAAVIVDSDGRILVVNKQTERLFGYRRDELVGQQVELLIPRRLRLTHPGHRERYLSDPKVRAMGSGLELYAVRKDGSEFPTEISLSPLDTDAGRLISASIRDISDRRRAQQALASAKDAAESANRELESFSYSVAHDLRAPLRGMNGFAQLLLDTYGSTLDEEGRDWLQEIQQNAKRMAALIDALLTLSRVSRSELHPIEVDLSALVRLVFGQLSAIEPQRKVELIARDGLRATLDPMLARALIENLVGNAWKFTSKRDSGRIELGETARNGVSAFFIADNGAGFDMTYADKLFGPFQRLHTEDQFGGTGIGLATVQRIVRRHGGSVWAQGEVDGGATFFFSVPEQGAVGDD